MSEPEDDPYDPLLEKPIAATEELSSLSGRPFHSVPIEIWQMIFERTMPPAYLVHLPGTLLIDCDSLASAVAEQQRTIVTVCRAWYYAGLRCLYEDVVIRWPTQLFALFRSLSENPSLCPLLLRLHLCCPVPDNMFPQFSDTVDSIGELCPALSEIDLGVYVDIHQLPLFNPLRFSGLVTQLELTYFPTATLSAFTQSLARLLVDLSPVLIHFSLNIQHCIHHGLLSEALSLEFPHLESLKLLLLPSCLFDLAYIEAWNLPSLRNFTMGFFTSFRGETILKVSNRLKSFLEVHGKSLRYLHLKPPATFERFVNGLYDIQSLVDLCPNLRHLVVPPWPLNLTHHDNIQWLDAWEFCAYPHELSADDMRSGGLMSLSGIRTLSMTLCAITDLPLRIPPWVDSDGQNGCEVKFGDFHLECRDGSITTSEEVWPDEDEDEDSTYDPDRNYTCESTDSEWESGSDVSTGVGEEDIVGIFQTPPEEEKKEGAEGESQWTGELNVDDVEQSVEEGIVPDDEEASSIAQTVVNLEPL